MFMYSNHDIYVFCLVNMFMFILQYTHSGKKVEVAVKKILSGEDVTVRSAYCNPESLDYYYNIPQLSSF